MTSLSTRCALLVVLTCSLTSCVDTASKPQRRFPDSSYQEPESSTRATVMPWEVWAPFQDLNGQRLSNKDILLGDELVEAGKRRAALDAYLRAKSESLLPREAESVVLRVASQYLALDQADRSLSAVSGYFKSRGLNEAQVELPFSLILAFAYGRKGDIDQSLAWFSRAQRQSLGKGFGAEIATKGSQLLLRTVQPLTFETMAVKWRADQFINEQIGRERLRRASAGYDESREASLVPFWSAYGDATMAAGSLPVGPRPGAEPVVGVILSLSDKFGSLGRDTRQGIDLAIEADPEQPKIKVEMRDVGADTVAASAAVRELAAGPGASVIVGPLLTEAAVSAAGTAREVGVPLVSFSKSESFKTGGDIFRLGATTSSQINSLVDVAFGEYKIARYAIVYPESANGTEFLHALQSKLGSLNLPLVLELSYASGDEASMLTAAQQLESSTAEAVLIPDSIEVSARLLSSLSPAVRRKIRPLGTALWDNPVKIANSQAVFEGSLFVTPFFPQSTRSVVQQFVQSYRGKYQTAPNFLAAQGFDVGTLVRMALRDAQRTSKTFAQALASLPPYDGVTGAITVDPSGGIRRVFNVVEVTADQFLEKTPGGEVRAFDGTITYRGNQRLNPESNEPIQDPHDTVDSGY
jgi:branched-chain amino acid transport system substrate-binding protein